MAPVDFTAVHGTVGEVEKEWGMEANVLLQPAQGPRCDFTS